MGEEETSVGRISPSPPGTPPRARLKSVESVEGIAPTRAGADRRRGEGG
ncbi:hypothetical protein AB0K60_15015 [Thermopolyspora sp. NPDC052614]